MEIPFCGESYKDRSQDANAQACINLYPFKSPTPQNKDRIILYPTPGYLSHVIGFTVPTLFALLRLIGRTGYEMEGTETRAMLNINDVVYYVVGNRFMLEDTGSGIGTFEPKGTLLTSSGKVSIVTNTVDITMSDGKYGYVYNLTTKAFTVIPTTGGFPEEGVTNLTFMDDYYIGLKNGSRQVVVSNLLDGTKWDALATDTVTSFPDDGVGVFSDQNQLYIFGRQVAEVQFDAATIPYPFEKVSGVLIQAGLAAVDTLVKVGTTVMWLANDVGESPYVAALIGYTVVPISTAPINEEICRFPIVSDAFAYTYREGDDQFYVITFPSGNKTYAYSLKGKMWHERQYNGGADLPLCCTYINKQVSIGGATLNHLVGDAEGGIYVMSQDWSQAVYNSVFIPDAANGGNVPKYWPPIRTRVSPHFEQGGKKVFLKRFELKYQAGVGVEKVAALNIFDGFNDWGAEIANPQATLYVSKDGGNEWINVGSRKMGKMGKYRQRMIWRNLGWAFTWTFKIVISDPVFVYILGADVDIKLGK